MHKQQPATTTPMVCWEETDGHRFPSVALGGDLRWVAYHSVSPGTSWIDGRLVHGDDRLRDLDLVAINAPDVDFDDESFDLDTMRSEATRAWDDGRVLLAGMDLMVPVASFGDDVLRETFTRFSP